MELKDILWEELNKESNKIVEISHRPMTIPIPASSELEDDDDGEEWDDENADETEYYQDDDDDDVSKYKGIGWDDL